MNTPISEPLLVSLVIPVFNEEAMVRRLLERLASFVNSRKDYRWELILINDGSSDNTVQEIVKNRSLFPGALRLVDFSRNFGHQPALTAGLLKAAGDAIICMDADLQDPPELIDEMLARFKEGFEIVYAVRQRRAGNAFLRAAYSLFYRLLQKVADTPIPLDAGDFGLISRRAAELMTRMPERDIFLRGLRSWIGFKQIGIAYHRPEREAGSTKYSLAKLLKLSASAFFGFSLLPLRAATSIGFIAVIWAVGYTAFIILDRLVNHNQPPGWASLVSIISFIGGSQLICIGILGEYIGRIYRQVQARPLFVIAEEREL